MKLLIFTSISLFVLCCNSPQSKAKFTPVDPGCMDYTPWVKFLRTLPVTEGQIKDYRGNAIADQTKHFQLVNYDVGSKDLQQCADFLIRLRAEFLFAQNRLSEISFRFTDGQPFSFQSYCSGKTPVLADGSLRFNQGQSRSESHATLRQYLDYVYAYAGTVSLNRDLAEENSFEIGTIIIQPGTPGHCMIIIDEKLIEGKIRYKLAESFMPAQTPYILKNREDGTEWYTLEKGKPIRTSSFHFSSYNLRTFE